MRIYLYIILFCAKIEKKIFEAFDRAGKEVSVCGEMAGNPESAVLLTGLGAKKLSMSMANMAGVKATLSKVTVKQAEELAEKCCNMRTEAEIKEAIKGVMHF